MDAPIVRIHIAHNERDISDRIESFSFEDCIKEDDIVTLKIKVGYVLDTADDADFITGNMIRFQFGFAGKQLSTPGLAKISDVEVTYADRISMTVKAVAVSNLMKKKAVLGGINGKSASDVIKEYAAQNHMKYKIDEPTQKHKNMAITGNTFETLQKCAALEPSGDYVCYVKGDTIHYERRKYDAPSSLTFTYGQPGFISFSPKWKEVTSKGGANNTVAVSVDPKTKETKEEAKKADSKELGVNTVMIAGNERDRAKGRGKATVSADALPEDTKKESVKAVVAVPDAGKTTASGKEKNKAKVLQASLVLNGSPLITPNSVVTIMNVAQRHSGNWLVEKVKHEISAGSPYKTTLELTKNGVNKASSNTTKKADTVNNTEGPKEQVKIHRIAAQENKR